MTTGHADGVRTLDLDETDPAHREQMRVRLDEPYRTVLGHLRHEIGPYYQPILVPLDSPVQAQCRQIFGDERGDYERAMERHYARGAEPDSSQRFVIGYASMRRSSTRGCR